MSMFSTHGSALGGSLRLAPDSSAGGSEATLPKIKSSSILPTLRKIEGLKLHWQKVLVRADLNVPLKGDEITDDARIVAAVPTILHILKEGGLPIVCSHLEPKSGGKESNGQKAPTATLRPVAERLREILIKEGVELEFLSDCVGPGVELAIRTIPKQNYGKKVILLENLRLHSGEKANDPVFASALRRLADIYVNDAFGSGHREHASTSLVASNEITDPFPPENCVAGMLMIKEIAALEKVFLKPKYPLAIIIGGGPKLDTKLPILEALASRANAETTILFAGGPGTMLLTNSGDQITQLTDLVKQFRDNGATVVTPEDSALPPSVDIGKETIAKFKRSLADAKVVAWNGTLGMAERENSSKGTVEIAEFLSKRPDCFTLVGGGDTGAAIRKYGLDSNFNPESFHNSTGGGAMLEFIKSGTLPVLSKLEVK